MQIAVERPDQLDVIALIEELDAHVKPLYPAESHHGIDIPALLAPNVLFAVARDGRTKALGCGAIVLGPECGELKRMFTKPECRGRGVAKALLRFLEEQAVQKGCVCFALETGIRQPEALRLYERAGYVRCPPFGDYKLDRNSIFMRKLVRA